MVNMIHILPAVTTNMESEKEDIMGMVSSSFFFSISKYLYMIKDIDTIGRSNREGLP